VQATSSGAPPSPCSAPTQTGNLLDLTYSFNPGADNGNVVTISNNRDSTRSQTFSYDAVNRISSAGTTSTYSTSPGHCWGENYAYDNDPNPPGGGPFGNLTGITPPSTYAGCITENFSVTATSNNQLSATGFSYDASGNMLNDGLNSYAFNAASQMKSSAGVNYTYDGDGNRIQKSSGKIYWRGIGGEVLDESDSSGNVTDEYVFFAGRRIAHIVTGAQ